MLSSKEYLRVAIRVTLSIAVPVSAMLAILLVLTDGLKAEGSLELDAVDGLFLLVLVPAISVLLCILVSPVGRPFYAFLDRKNRKSQAPTEPNNEIRG